MNQRRKRNRWSREVGIYLAFFGIPMLILFPYWPWRPRAEFVASIHTDAVTLRIGADEAARAFAAPIVNLTIEGANRIETPLDPPRQCRTLALTHAQVSSFLLVAGTEVYVESGQAQRKGIRLQLLYPATLEQAPIQAFLGDDSSMRCDNVAVTLRLPGPIKAFPQNSGLVVGLAPVNPNPSVALLSDAFIPALEERSAITFLNRNRKSAIHGFADSTVDVTNAGRKLHIANEVLEIGGVGPLTAAQIRVTGDGLAVEAKGSAGVLRVGDEDARPSWLEYLLGRTELSSWIKTAVLIGTAVLTMLSRLKLIQLEDKSS